MTQLRENKVVMGMHKNEMFKNYKCQDQLW